MGDFDELKTLAADLGKGGEKAIRLGRIAVKKAAADIEASAKGNAPVDTGNLRASITTTIWDLTAEIGPTAIYGPYVEFGTSKMPPQPYLGPAIKKHGPAFEQAIGKIASDIL